MFSILHFNSFLERKLDGYTFFVVLMEVHLIFVIFHVSLCALQLLSEREMWMDARIFIVSTQVRLIICDLPCFWVCTFVPFFKKKPVGGCTFD